MNKFTGHVSAVQDSKVFGFFRKQGQTEPLPDDVTTVWARLTSLRRPTERPASCVARLLPGAPAYRFLPAFFVGLLPDAERKALAEIVLALPPLA